MNNQNKKDNVNELFEEWKQKLNNMPGGYEYNKNNTPKTIYPNDDLEKIEKKLKKYLDDLSYNKLWKLNEKAINNNLSIEARKKYFNKCQRRKEKLNNQ